MQAHLRQWMTALRDSFCLIPLLLTLLGFFGAVAAVQADSSGMTPQWLIENAWVYNGGGTGARTLLGAVASSVIGVAGTVFSIIIAALSFAAGQMGPRLLRNFTRDRGVQFTLGAYTGTFTYALMVLRSVRTHDEGTFIPHLSLTLAIALALICVILLVYFVGHMSSRINVDTVVTLVSDDLAAAMSRLEPKRDAKPPMPSEMASVDVVLRAPLRGYLQEIDAHRLTQWCANHRTRIRLLVRQGDYVFPGAPFALTTKDGVEAEPEIVACMALGRSRVSSTDLELTVRQLVEVAVRALSPGINDPQTAINVIDQLGSTLCDLARLELPSGRYLRDDKILVQVPAVEYDGLMDSMFHQIRQNGSSDCAILLRMLEVLAAVASCEVDPGRRATLRRHATLVLEVGQREIKTSGDRADLEDRARRFHQAMDGVFS